MMAGTRDLTRRVKGRLLPLGPFARVLEKLVEMLPRRALKIHLVVAQEISALDVAKGEYRAHGNTAAFAIGLTPELASGGWFYFEAALVRHNGNREARIHGRTSGQASGTFEIFIPANLRGTIREVFSLPRDVSALHWSPTADPGFFSQSELLIHKITAVESILRRLHRVLSDLWRFRHEPPANRGGLTWWGVLSNLQDTYTRTAKLQVQRYRAQGYDAFIERNDTLTAKDEAALRVMLSTQLTRPGITLIVVAQSPQTNWLRAAIEAVTHQIYPEWELLITGECSAGSEWLAEAEAWKQKDRRIKPVCSAAEATKAELFNQALQVAQGGYIAEMGQHDILPSHALSCIAADINQHLDVALIYTDHDELDATGRRTNHCFKPDWNPDLLLSHNYLGSLCIYRTSLVRGLGGYRRAMEGAEAYDLALRCVKQVSASEIRHIPRVLCHTRLSVEAAEDRIARDNRVHESGKRALVDYFGDSDVRVEDGPASGLYRACRYIPADRPLVTIVIPTRDKPDLLKTCIESIEQRTDYTKWELLIVDNGSSERATLDYLASLRRRKSIRVLEYSQPFNYSAINNFAVRHANGEVLALLNNDVEVITPNWLTEMVSHAIRSEVGAVGAKLLYSNGLVQHAGVVLGIGGVAGHAHKYLDGEAGGYCHRAELVQNFSAVTGACLVVRKRLYEEVSGLNEVNLRVALNDVDFCLRLRQAGYRNVFTPYARLFHHESLSRGHDDTPEKHAIFVQERRYLKETWGEMLACDPAYNRNLTLEREDFSLTINRRPHSGWSI